jgi:hypothetical protein
MKSYYIFKALVTNKSVPKFSGVSIRILYNSFDNQKNETIYYIVDGLCEFMFTPLGLGPWTKGPHNMAVDGWGVVGLDSYPKT